MGTIKTAPGLLCVMIVGAGLVASACGPGSTGSPALPAVSGSPVVSAAASESAGLGLTPSPIASPTSSPFPAVTLQAGDAYFSVQGKQSFLLSRNPTGKTLADFDTALGWAQQGGARVIRVHLTHGWWDDPWINADWSVNEKWARDWDGFFDQAAADGISVIPVFGVWADWNDGTPNWGSDQWQYNPLNSAKGGPVSAPGQLFESGSATQKNWLAWVKTLVTRWQGRPNIAAWEIFSELNIASGAKGHADAKGGVDEATGVDFTNQAMDVIHGADTQHHPVTLSLAGVYSARDAWAKYYDLASLDFVEIHPYSDTLDRELVKEIRADEATYKKPVMIGESGLWSMDAKPNAPVGVRHAMWAGLVSGAMNGRALWGPDGYWIYGTNSAADQLAAMQSYATVGLSVANFTSGVDFSGFKPLNSTSTAGVWGAAVGNDKSVLGWYRDAASEPPNWALKPSLCKQTATVAVPGSASGWRVDFYDTTTGTTLLSSTTVERRDGTVTVPLPCFHDDIAFKLNAG
jgi:hypothetical protein